MTSISLFSRSVNRVRGFVIQVILALTVILGIGAGPLQAAQTLFTSQTPASPDAADGTSYELGMKFTAGRSGQITSLRYWKSPSETGAHTGRLWSSSGTLLASVAFGSETASGWQEQALAAPVAIAANTTYVVSVNANDHFAITVSGLAAAVVNTDLSSIADGANGVFGGSGTFPGGSYQNSNYFRDVVFAPDLVSTLAKSSGDGQTASAGSALPLPLAVIVRDASNNPLANVAVTFGVTAGAGSVSPATAVTDATGMASTQLTLGPSAGQNTVHATAAGVANAVDFTATATAAALSGQRVFTTQTPALANVSDGIAYEMGMKFRAAKSGKITGIRYWKAASDPGTHVGRLWSSTGTPLGSVTFAGETASGWQEQALSTPVAILANTTYVVSVNISSYYAATSAGLAAAIVNGDLSSVADGANGVFGTAVGGFPSLTYQNGNYFRDVVFVADAAAGPTLTGVSVSPTSVNGGTAATGTVTLSAAATAATVVNLASSDTLSATVPANVTVAAGQTTATFTIATAAVAANASVTISGTYSGVTQSSVLTVTPVPPALSSVTVSPTSVQGGTSATGTVTLTAAATAATTVTLASSNTAAATVPASVTVAAGQTTGTFAITTLAVAANTTSTISGTYSGVTKNSVLTVTPLPPALSSVTVSPTSVQGGTSSTGTVTLTAAATAATTVTLASSNTAAATVPASVTVAVGQTSATFTITTLTVAANTTSTISGTYSGVTQSSVLTVTPVPPALSSVTVSPTSVQGGTSSTGTVTLTAAATAATTVTLASSNTAAATVPASVTVAVGQTSATFAITTLTVAANATSTISGTYSGVTQSSVLTVTPLPPALSSVTVSPTSVQGGTSATGTVTLTAAATAATTVTLASSNTAAATVPASVTVAAGQTSATFTITTLTVAANATSTISGTYSGVTQSSVLTVTPVPPALSSVTLSPTSVQGGTSATGTVTLTAAATAATTVTLASSNVAAATVPASVTVAAGQTSATFTITTFTVAANATSTISGTYSGVTQSSVLTVTPLPPALSSVTVSPTSVQGGTSSTGTVTLTAAATAATTVTLASSNTAAATVPASVTVAVGQTSATFTITTLTVAANATSTISGTYSGVTQSSVLTVTPLPPALSSVTVSPTSVQGGTSATGTVTLTAAATAATTVSLASSNTSAATVPASVTVAVGQTSATFTITTLTVAANATSTISGTYSGVTQSSVLTVTPLPPALSSVTVSPTSVQGGTSATGTVTLTAAATAATTVTLASSNTAAATVPASVTVAVGQTSATFTITTLTVAANATSTISGTYSGVTQSSALTVTPLPPALLSVTVSPTSVQGGTSATGTVTLTATATAATTVTLASSNTAAATVPASVTVAVGQTSATFTITTLTVAANATSTISGTYSGVTQSSVLTVTPLPPALSSVTVSPTSVQGGTSSTGTVTLTAAATAATTVTLASSNTAAATVPASVTVAAGQTSATFTITTLTVAANATSTISGTYSGVTQSSVLTVTPLPPALSSVTVSPTSVQGGTSATGTVTLTAAATAATTVSLASSNTSAATVPASVTVAVGQTSATFAITTLTVAANATSTISGTYSGVTQSSVLTVTPLPPALSSVTVSPTSVQGGTSATGTVTLTATATAATTVTLASSNTAAATVPASVTVAVGQTSATFTITTLTVAANATSTISGSYSGVTQSSVLTVTSAPAALSSIAVSPTSVVGGTSVTGTVTLTAAAAAATTVTLASSNAAIVTVPASVTVASGQTSATFSISTVPVAGTSTVTLTATYSAVSKTTSLTVNAAGISVFTSQAPTAANVTDGVPYEMGMKFRVARPGKITALRYYRAANDTGTTHVGRLWTAGGTQLGSVTFSGETASGWQQQALATPIAVQANTTYVVSVNTGGYFGMTLSGLAASVVNGDISSVADGADGLFGTPGTFPTGSYSSSNYFRDVVFVADSQAGVYVAGGNLQAGTPGSTLPTPLTVLVKDAIGNVVPGTTVVFAVTGGGGTLSATSVITDASGQAGTTLTLGASAGQNTVTATANGSTVTFSATGTNAIVAENLKPGTPNWQITNAVTAASPEILGYAGAQSVNLGGSLPFKISLAAAGQYTIDVYRLGWYAGIGARKLLSAGPFTGTVQPACGVTDAATKLIECNWATSYTLNVSGSDWTTGLYVANLTASASGKQSQIWFVVRDDSSHADVLFMSAFNTYVAYNNFGTSEQHSLYGFNSTGGVPALKVSLDRPFAQASSDPGRYDKLTTYEHNMVRWMESQGYDIAYTTNLDLDLTPAQINQHHLIMDGGHDEYWSLSLRDTIENARNAGRHMAFFSGNTAFWRVRFEPSSTGTANRVMVCYKCLAGTGCTADPVAPTTLFRDPAINRPENALLGAMYVADDSYNMYGGYDFIVSNASDPYYANTGVTNGQSLGLLVGYEWDAVTSNGLTPAGAVVLGSSTPTSTNVGPENPVGTNPNTSNAVRYTHSSGAKVFTTGSIQWVWGLNSDGVTPARTSTAAQQMFINIMADMNARPATPDAGLIVP